MAQYLRSWAVPIAKLDRVVAQIVRLLQKDGRLSTTEIARASGVSEPTVRRKLARLLEEGIITVRAVSDPIALGYAAPAYIGLDVDRPKIEEVATVLSRYPMIESVAVVTGPYDLLIKAAFHSTAELYDFVLKELTKVEGIKDSNSFLVLKSFKHAGLEGVALAPDEAPDDGRRHRRNDDEAERSTR